MMRKYVLVFLILASALAYSQNTFTISGLVTDTKNQPIVVGDVLLLPTNNDIPNNYTTLIDGNFSMASVPPGSYRLQISCLGFELLENVIKLDENMFLSFRLIESATNLDEVEVIAAKPIITNSNGNLKIDVTNQAFSSIADPMELLSRLPNLQVGLDRESVTVLGKGVPLIYLGNQRVSLEEFNTLSVTDISTIEVIKNPSSKYEASGRAVLLITKKKNTTEGIKGNLSETVSFKRDFNNYAALNGSFKRKKLTLKGNFAYNDLLQWESHQFEFAIPEADILSDYLVLVDRNNRVELNMGGGLFYQINETDYFSANITSRSQTNKVVIDTDTFLREGADENSIISESDNENNKDFISGNFNYSKKLNSKINLFTGLQYSSFVQRLDTHIINNFNAMGFVPSQERQQKYQIEVLAYRLDIEKVLKNDMKLEMGANISDAKANALTNTQVFEPEENTNIDYGYTEKTYASYAQLSGNLSEKINVNLGLRMENNQVQGEVQSELIPVVDRENTSLFPKALFNLEIDSTKNLSFSYSRSIERPNYSRASSISTFINPFLEGTGNVNLRPTLTEEVSANFQIKKSSLSINYLRRKNPMFFSIGYEDGADNAVLSLQNLEKESGIDVALTVPITKGIWTSTNTGTIATRRVEDMGALATTVKPYLYFYTDHQFKLQKDTTISFGGWGLTKRFEGIFKRNAMAVLNASITKTFFNKLSCSLRFNDITRAMNFEESYAIKGVKANGVYFVDAHELAFSMKYTFGKINEPNYKNKAIDENLNRIR